MAKWFKSDKAERTFLDAARGLAAVNGAGVAGVIGLLERQGPAPWTLVAAGSIFILGVLMGGAAWFWGYVVEEAPEVLPKGSDKYAGFIFFGSAVTFVAGIAFAFAYAITKHA